MFSPFKKKQKEAQAVLPVIIEPAPERRTNDAGDLQEKRILPEFGEIWVNLQSEE